MIKMADPIIKDEEINAVVDVLKSGHIARGKKVAEFENNWSDYVGVPYSIATNNGTSALHTALLACGVRQGDEVIAPAFSFFATASQVTMCGATVEFCDVDLDGNIRLGDVKRLINSKTAAVVAVNLYGKQVEKMEQLDQVCVDFDINLVVDSCQCPDKVGAQYGDVSCFSFYATKNITTGEGGMISTRYEDIAKTARRIIDHGQTSKYEHKTIGLNYRMNDIAAAIGVEQLKRLPLITKRRQEIAGIYSKMLHSNTNIYTPETYTGGPNHVYHQYVIRVLDGIRDKLAGFLHLNDIETAVHYPKPIYMQQAYRKHYNGVYCPCAEALSKEVLSIPCHPGLTDEDVKYVAHTINDYFEAEK